MRQIGRDPVFIESASGCRMTATDGRDYIDWVGSWGPMILGHADPDVLDAVGRAASRGTSFGAATEGEVELAEAVVERVPSVEMIRMTSSGTEAAMAAVRLARAVTGREKVVKFSGAYHGHSDALLVDAGSGVATLAIPSSPGIPESAASATLVVPWNETAAVELALDSNQVAALLVEPVPANMGVVPPEEGFLDRLREICDRNGTMLVFDEVITGFRVSRGGAQQFYGVEPDLTVMGKVIGGGLPAAALGGPRQHMERLAPSGDVYQAGTLSGNPVAVAAGLATLSKLDPAAYGTLGRLTDRLEAGLRDLASRHGLEVAAVPGLVTLFFTDRPVRDFEGAAATDLERHAGFCRAMLDRGVYVPPSQFEAWFVSLAHDDQAIDLTLEAAAESLERSGPIAQGGRRG